MHEKTSQLLLVDDHTAMLDGLKTALDASGYSQIQTANSVERAKERLNETPPDLVLIDIRLPDGSGLALAREVKRYMPQTKVLFLTMLEDRDTLDAAMATEAEGFLVKTTGLAGVVRAVTSLLDGACVYPAGRQPSKYRPKVEAPPTLTGREEDVLACLGQGLSNKEIARGLDMAEGTVKVHIKTILKKLRVRNRTQAAIYAYEHGYNVTLHPHLKDSA